MEGFVVLGEGYCWVVGAVAGLEVFVEGLEMGLEFLVEIL